MILLLYNLHSSRFGWDEPWITKKPPLRLIHIINPRRPTIVICDACVSHPDDIEKVKGQIKDDLIADTLRFGVMERPDPSSQHLPVP